MTKCLREMVESMAKTGDLRACMSTWGRPGSVASEEKCRRRVG